MSDRLIPIVPVRWSAAQDAPARRTAAQLQDSYGSVAIFHQWRAEDSSPFTLCRACGIERHQHGADGRTSHWFVSPRQGDGT